MRCNECGLFLFDIYIKGKLEADGMLIILWRMWKDDEIKVEICSIFILNDKTIKKNVERKCDEWYNLLNEKCNLLMRFYFYG